MTHELSVGKQFNPFSQNDDGGINYMRRKIIKTLSLLVVLVLLLTLCACESGSGSSTDKGDSKDDHPEMNIGVLTMLNLSEEETEDLVTATIVADTQLVKDFVENNADEGEKGPDLPSDEERPTDAGGNPINGPKVNVTFYDSLDSMLMALNAGDISSMMVYLSTANYLCATNEDLAIEHDNTGKIVDNSYSRLVTRGILSNSFSFLMLESNSALRDEFNTAIQAMKDDGTMQTLIAEQIDAYKSGDAIKAVSLPQIAGADTIKVAVTGSLPPMDYVAADGSPAGFNTAVLAEISQRIGKNIEIVVVDSIGRAAALSSGTVDAVFWTRTSEPANNMTVPLSDDEIFINAKANMSDKELTALEIIDSLIDFANYGKMDMPEGTIITNSYFSDSIVQVTTKAGKEQREAEQESRRAEKELEKTSGQQG